MSHSWPREVYLLSFVFVGIYWNNHHHLFQAARRVNGWVLWANLHWLFWLSLVPFVTNWVGDTNFSALPVAVAYTILTHVLVALHGRQSALAVALGGDFKGWVSLLIYAAAVPVAFAAPLVSAGLFALVALIWLVPDRRIEKVIEDRPAAGK